MHNSIKPYFAKNMIINATETTDETGFITVNTFTALGALPVSNAEVSVYTWNEEEGYSLIKSVVTDSSGKAPPIELPVLINRGKTFDEEQTEYHLVVRGLGFHTIIIIHVEVFPDITTQFNVNLTPVPRGEQNRNETLPIPAQIKNPEGGSNEK